MPSGVSIHEPRAHLPILTAIYKVAHVTKPDRREDYRRHHPTDIIHIGIMIIPIIKDDDDDNDDDIDLRLAVTLCVPRVAALNHVTLAPITTERPKCYEMG